VGVGGLHDCDDNLCERQRDHGAGIIEAIVMTTTVGSAAGPEPRDTASTADRNVQARSSERVYQAAGDLHIYGERSSPSSVTPCNTLPRDTVAFTGRDHELRTLTDAARQGAVSGSVIPVFAIEGMPGVGKSALAVHAGHLLRDRFPDGQFFLDLHAYTAGHRPMEPGDALFALLSASGVEPSQIPAGVDERATVWRSRMAGLRILLILDNAAGRWQVQPLLPGASGSMVIVTSRRRLVGLGAHQAAVTLTLDTLSPDDATELFATISGRRSNGVEAGAVHELVRLSGYLPLAICLLSARLGPEPQWRIADLVGELTKSKHRLTHMRAEDLAVEPVFDVSYGGLPASRRRFFRRLGLHPGPDLDRFAAAALNGISPAAAQRHLDTLYDDHLLDQPALGRYRMHDLIADYTRTRAERDPVADREKAIARMLDYYQQAAGTADRQLSRSRVRTAVTLGGLPAALPELGTRQQALAWFGAERANLLACTAVMPGPGKHRRVIYLAAAMATYLRLTGPWDRAISLHHEAAIAALRERDAQARADALFNLGVLHRLTGQYALAGHVLRQALRLYEQIGHPSGVAQALTEIAGVQWRTGDNSGAAAGLGRALAICQDISDPHGEADVYDALGAERYFAADYRGAIDSLRRALAIYRDLGDDQGTANALNQIGVAQQLTGEDPAAIEAHEQALIIYRRLGDRYGQCRALNYLGFVRCQSGECAAARTALMEALTMHRELGYRAGEANALNYLGTVYRRTGDYAAAEWTYNRALAMYLDLGYRVGEADVYNELGIVARLTGDCDVAAQKHQRALAMFEQLTDLVGQAEALNCLGDVSLARDELSQARHHHRRALDTALRAHSPRDEADARLGLGRCALRLGKPEEAAEEIRQAEAIYRRIGALPDARAAAELLESVSNVRADAVGKNGAHAASDHASGVADAGEGGQGPARGRDELRAEVGRLPVDHLPGRGRGGDRQP
jgi:tetratricopeptide (TPR) repeat protein